MQNTDATKYGLVHRISKSISCHCASFYTKLPRKMCEGCTNSLEKCVEGDDIYQEKCEITVEYPMKNVE